MQKNTENIEILEDKARAEKLFSKQELQSYETKQNEIPSDYFEKFEAKILNDIASLNKKNKGIFTIPKWGQLAIAASFFTIIASTYILIQSNNHKSDVAINISIQEIATAEIDAYVSENEALAEIDWQAEINKEGKNLENLNAHLIKDSNNTQ